MQLPAFFFTFSWRWAWLISRIFSGRIVDREKNNAGNFGRVVHRGIQFLPALGMRLHHRVEQHGMQHRILCSGIAAWHRLRHHVSGLQHTVRKPLAPNSQRGTATSTYLTSWDVGIGIGMLTGGYIAEVSTFDKAYLFGACLTIVSMLYFNIKVTPHYHKNKLR